MSKAIAIEELIIDRMIDGKVQDHSEQFDQSPKLHQLGLASTTA